MTRQLPTPDAVFELLADQGRPLKSREIAARLRVLPRSFGAMQRLLTDLAYGGKLDIVRGERFALPRGRGRQAPEERIGTFAGNPRGFGFVRTIGYSNDVFIGSDAIAGALHGDRVRITVLGRKREGLEGRVEEVISRGQSRVVGTIVRKGKSSWLEPDDARMRGPILIRGEKKGTHGKAAVVNLSRYPEYPDECPEAELSAVLGNPGEPKVEIAKILAKGGVVDEYPRAAVQEARAFGNKVPESALEGRLDLTHLPMPTIDPKDARDHDDAIWVERTQTGGFRAHIAIADVSHYVQRLSALDEASLERGCSVYLPTRAIPMLPPELSTHLCSLVPNELRLCMAVIAEFDSQGNMLRSSVHQAYMYSQAKLNYEGVAHALGFSKLAKPQKAASKYLGGLKTLDLLARMLRERRMKRGALALDLPEPKIEIDEESGEPTSIERRSGDPGLKRAYQMVEEMMLLANEVVANFLVDNGAPAIFRVHGPPDEQKLERFADFCEDLGVVANVEDFQNPKRLSAVLKRLETSPRANVLQMLLLRAMKQASYDIANIGHFGLASSAYLHFTSPIRRYPDLNVHRIVKHLLEYGHYAGDAFSEDTLRQAAQQSSDREREVMEVEREVVNLYRAMFMQDRVGETFDGTVTGVTGHGVYVALDSPYVDVLIRTDSLGKEHYELLDEQMKYVARRSGDSIALGDRVKLTVEDVSLSRRSVYGFRHSPAMDEDAEGFGRSVFDSENESDAGYKGEKDRRQQRRLQSNQRDTLSRVRKKRDKAKGTSKDKGKSKGKARGKGAVKGNGKPSGKKKFTRSRPSRSR